MESAPLRALIIAYGFLAASRVAAILLVHNPPSGMRDRHPVNGCPTAALRGTHMEPVWRRDWDCQRKLKILQFW